jgi:hypothetical protein
VKRCGKSAPAFRVTGMARQTPPEARPRRPHHGAIAQAPEGCSPEPAGRPLEAPGDGVSRWMVAAALPDSAAQNPAYRPTRPPQACTLHVQLVEPLSVRIPSTVESAPSTESIASRVRSSESGHRWSTCPASRPPWRGRDGIAPFSHFFPCRISKLPSPGSRSAMTELSESCVAQSFPALLFADDRGREGA